LSTIYIGIDNGVSGSIGIIDGKEQDSTFLEMPTYSQQDYTKKEKNITRIAHNKLCNFLVKYWEDDKVRRVVLIERPMVNPGRFKATGSALRCLESVLIAVQNTMPTAIIIYVDSKEWQKVMLPKGIQKEDLKTASAQVGCRLFPRERKTIQRHGDADALLMAEWARRTKL